MTCRTLSSAWRKLSSCEESSVASFTNVTSRPTRSAVASGCRRSCTMGSTRLCSTASRTRPSTGPSSSGGGALLSCEGFLFRRAEHRWTGLRRWQMAGSDEGPGTEQMSEHLWPRKSLKNRPCMQDLLKPESHYVWKD